MKILLAVDGSDQSYEAARALAAGEIPSDILGQSEPPPAV